MVQIIDYGMGNLRSVQKAFERLGVTADIITQPADIKAADHLVLPGVGAFRDAIRELHRFELVEPIRRHVEQNKPFLGICLGLQLLFDVSYEDGEYEGLGIVPGRVVRFPPSPGLKIPHMGWNAAKKIGAPTLYAGVPDEATFYFVHSYYVEPADRTVVATETEHGVAFASSIQRGNLFATQFHPEKSQQAGLKLLANFARIPALAAAN